jgi:hypothetical protein
MKPIMRTDTKMTGKLDAMALSGRTNVNISFLGGVVPVYSGHSRPKGTLVHNLFQMTPDFTQSQHVPHYAVSRLTQLSYTMGKDMHHEITLAER